MARPARRRVRLELLDAQRNLDGGLPVMDEPESAPGASAVDFPAR